MLYRDYAERAGICGGDDQEGFSGIIMKKLVLLGAGGHCLSVLSTLKEFREYEDIVILDAAEKCGRTVLGYPVIGTDDKLQDLYQSGYRYAFVAIASIKTTAIRRKLWNRLRETGFQMINVIDPTAIVDSETNIGEGVFIGKKAVVNAGSSIGDMAIINTGAIVEHGCEVGDFAHVSVGTVLCGEVKAASDVFIGANATIFQGIRISRGAVIGAGSIIRMDVEESRMVCTECSNRIISLPIQCGGGYRAAIAFKYNSRLGSDTNEKVTGIWHMLPERQAYA